jgi:hypothetical protein
VKWDAALPLSKPPIGRAKIPFQHPSPSGLKKSNNLLDPVACGHYNLLKFSTLSLNQPNPSTTNRANMAALTDRQYWKKIVPILATLRFPKHVSCRLF